MLKGKGRLGLAGGCKIVASEVSMAQMTPQVSELLEKALTLSTEERRLLVSRLGETLEDEVADEGVEAAWDEEIKRRVDDIRSGRVPTIPGQRVRERLDARLRNGRA